MPEQTKKRNTKDDTHCVHCGYEFGIVAYDEEVISEEVPATDTTKRKPKQVKRHKRVVREGDIWYLHECDEMMPEHVEVGPRYFACICSGESRAECKWIMEETLRLLSGETTELSARRVTRENLLTNVVVSLNWDYHANITSILNDQWSGISSETYCYQRDTPEFTTYIQCDSLEDGIAATWMAYYQKFGKERPLEGDDDHD